MIHISTSVYRYRATRDGQAPLRMRIKEIAAVRVRYGYKRIQCSCVVKAGRSITSGCTGYTVRKG